MARHKNDRGRSRAPLQETASLNRAPGSRVVSWRLLALALVVASAGLWVWLLRAPAPSSGNGPAGTDHPRAETNPPAAHVGASACKNCHAAEYAAWKDSHHARAMLVADEQTVLGDFADARFRQRGTDTRFFRKDGRFMVRTEGHDGKPADFEIRYTFGVHPLQQYLVAFPGGRFQALPIAWDTRPARAGGQRWFHLQPGEKIDPKDPLHWTGRYQNWALQCAECHSTGLRKGYDAENDRYETTYSEINVACEACHGPGSHHVEWAGRARPPYSPGEDKGLVRLRSGWQQDWTAPGNGARTATRSRPADPAAMNTCAACHARRATLTETRIPGAPLEDSHRLALLTAPNYHADGQQREEVYVWGSFLQSRMARHGVTCLDCHEPHTHRLRAAGNALCTRCHEAAAFDVPAHHHHQVDGGGSRCIACHMPAQNYMIIHARPDHSLRVPRPDLAQAMGSPDACTQCHTDRQPAWAASTLDAWYGKNWRERPHYGPVLHAGQTRGLPALPGLLALAENGAMPGIVRATAASLAQPMAGAAGADSARRLARDGDPGVRIAALGLAEGLEAATRIDIAAPALADPVRGVRIEAARVLADLPDERLPAVSRPARLAALQEYEAALALNADWPSFTAELGDLRWRQGRSGEALAAYERAIRLDPRFATAYVNLADLQRQGGDESGGEATLRRGIAARPDDGDLRHALGLSLARQGRQADAVAALAAATRLDPGQPRHAYAYAIALHSSGKPEAALAALRSASKRHPQDIGLLSALVSISRARGDTKTALSYARQAAAAWPDNPDIARLIAELEATGAP